MENRPTKILGLTLLLGGLALCCAGLWLLLSPAQYQATARIKVEWDAPTSDEIIDYLKGHSVDMYDPDFLAYTLKKIQSEAVLTNVIETLNLNVEWGKKYGNGSSLETTKTIKLLQRRMKLEPIRNTKLIEIHFRSDDPDEAARIANAIASAYRDYRIKSNRQMSLTGLQVLEDAFPKEQQDIQVRQKILEQLRKQLDVPNPEPSDDVLKTNYPAYFQAKQELQKKIDLLKLLKAKITADQMGISLPKYSMVLIIDAAQPPKFPSSPNRLLGRALLAIGLFSTLGGLFLLKSSHRC